MVVGVQVVYGGNAWVEVWCVALRAPPPPPPAPLSSSVGAETLTPFQSPSSHGRNKDGHFRQKRPEEAQPGSGKGKALYLISLMITYCQHKTNDQVLFPKGRFSMKLKGGATLAWG